MTWTMMFFKIKLHTIATFIFYTILLAVLIKSLKLLLSEPTTFEEIILQNQTVIPSLTLCPFKPENPNYSSIQSFEETMEVMESIRSHYKFEVFSEKAYEGA